MVPTRLPSAFRDILCGALTTLRSPFSGGRVTLLYRSPNVVIDRFEWHATVEMHNGRIRRKMLWRPLSTKPQICGSRFASGKAASRFGKNLTRRSDRSNCT